jgi:hypothetical protein
VLDVLMGSHFARLLLASRPACSGVWCSLLGADCRYCCYCCCCSCCCCCSASDNGSSRSGGGDVSANELGPRVGGAGLQSGRARSCWMVCKMTGAAAGLDTTVNLPARPTGVRRTTLSAWHQQASAAAAHRLAGIRAATQRQDQDEKKSGPISKSQARAVTARGTTTIHRQEMRLGGHLSRASIGTLLSLLHARGAPWRPESPRRP